MSALFASCPKGLEYLLVDELLALGADSAREARAGVYFEGSLSFALRACLWSRLASRILLPLSEFAVDSADSLYEGIRALDWEQHLDARTTLAVDVDGRTEGIVHSRFAAQRVKDAIVDQFRERGGDRPSVDLEDPDLRLHLLLKRARATISLDLSGQSLHRRGYRGAAGAAPLKENLAAALLIRAGWPELSAQGGALLDPMCGSGTLLIEGALMAADRAPGLQRPRFGFLGWRQCPLADWQALREEASERAQVGLAKLQQQRFFGSDHDAEILQVARANARAAGLGEHIEFRCESLSALRRPEAASSGLVITNPPYDERMAADPALYRALGDCLQREFAGWHASVLTTDATLGRATGLRAVKRYQVFNGALACQLLNFLPGSEHGRIATRPPLSEAALGLKNRLLKNRRQLRNWLRRENIECYRLYDADLPEYASAIDVYAGHVHVQEYQAPASVPVALATKRFEDTLQAVAEALEVPRERIHAKTRSRQRGESQYTRQASRGEFHEVSESGLQFRVNLDDYLDTGLFLDHRPMRAMLREQADDTRFLNLFCYTATASVYAADGGARSTTSVDLSPTYLAWAAHNFALNGFDAQRNRLIQADVMHWIADCDEQFDLIFVDPPTFSNSARTDTVFDVQRDHAALLQACLDCLAPRGEIFFSTNARRFKLDDTELTDLTVENISRASLPPDFARSPRIHQAWRLRRK